MKKLFAVALGAISAVCLLAGCSTNNNPASSAVDDAKQAGERMMEGTKRAVNDVVDMGTAGTGNMAQSGNNNGNGNMAQSGNNNGNGNMTQSDNKGKTDKSQFIGEEKAKSIALEKAGLSADAVTFDKVELDSDNGVWQYEVEFRKDRTEYDYDIKADDGSILSYDVDNDN